MPKILVVDDDSSAGDLFATLLRHYGYTTTAATSGQDALESLGSVLPDLVIVDMMMPDMNGLELLTRIRSNERTAELPVVMLSALDDADWQAKAADAGASDYWVKGGFDFGELEARVRARLPLGA